MSSVSTTRPSVDDLCRAWSILLHEIFCGSSEQDCYVAPGIGPGSDHRLAYSKVRATVARFMRERKRYGPKRSGYALELAVRVLERQGYVARTPLGDGPDQVIQLTEEGDLRLFFDTWPEFCDADLCD